MELRSAAFDDGVYVGPSLRWGGGRECLLDGAAVAESGAAGFELLAGRRREAFAAASAGARDRWVAELRGAIARHGRLLAALDGEAPPTSAAVRDAAIARRRRAASSTPRRSRTASTRSRGARRSSCGCGSIWPASARTSRTCARARTTRRTLKKVL